MKLEQQDVKALKADPSNVRLHDSRNVEAVKASLQQFGQQKPIVIGKNGTVVAGNATLEAARQLGWSKIAVVRSELEGRNATAYAIADNRTAELAEWSDDLSEVLASLQADDSIDHLTTGFTDAEIDELVAEATEPVEVVEDDVPEAPEKAVTKPGDLWLLGEHRLLCGDSTEEEDVRRLMGRERAGLMNTDPPYGVGYANEERPNPGVAKPRVANDGLVDNELQAFLEKAFRCASTCALGDSAAWYMWHAHLTQGYFAAAAAAAAAGVILHRQIIWVKPILLLGRGQYHWKHEPCFMGWVEGHRPPDYGRGQGERDQTTVWEIDGVSQADRKEYNHSTPKPVGLFTIPITKHLKRGEICYEPFAGSGPQFIAAEQLGRKCYGIEIEPKYCDVTVARWEKLTGRKAKRAKS